MLRRRFTIGTPDTLAAHLIERYEQRAADGFILMAPTLPDTLERFVEDIVPRLTDHGHLPARVRGRHPARESRARTTGRKVRRMSRRLLLGAFLFHPGGSHVSGWRHETAEPHRHVDIDYYARFAQTAERGVFDTIFLADGLYFWDRFPSGVDHYGQTRLEPLTLLSALAVRTSRIGLAATVSTSYNEPYHVARALASLDHISRGRAAWNLVTSRYDEEARNFGGDEHLDHALRYERGARVRRVVQQLWDSWADDAILADRESGLFADAEQALHAGPPRRPLHGARSAQRDAPAAGVSGAVPGRRLCCGAGARRRHRRRRVRPRPADRRRPRVLRRTQGACRRAGREADDVALLPSLRPVVAETEREARAWRPRSSPRRPTRSSSRTSRTRSGSPLLGPGRHHRDAPDVDIANESKSPNRVSPDSTPGSD